MHILLLLPLNIDLIPNNRNKKKKTISHKNRDRWSHSQFELLLENKYIYRRMENSENSSKTGFENNMN
jgi:hypothetical protein